MQDHNLRPCRNQVKFHKSKETKDNHSNKDINLAQSVLKLKRKFHRVDQEIDRVIIILNQGVAPKLKENIMRKIREDQ